MALDEFALIQRYFSDIFPSPAAAADILCGVGDDCAIVQLPASQQLVFSIDTQLPEVHFPTDADPAAPARGPKLEHPRSRG